MPNDIYQLLGISPEAEQVRQILQPTGAAQAPARQVYANPLEQSYGDYTTQLEQARDHRSNLAQEAEFARQAALPTFSGQRVRAEAYRKALQDALYEKQTGALLKDLHSLDPADPEHEIQQDEIFARHPIAHHALNDPRVASTVKRQAADYAQFQHLFDSDPAARKEYAALKTDQVDPAKARETVKQNALLRVQKEAFAKAGGDPEDFTKFVGEDGILDRPKASAHLAEVARVQKTLASPTVQKKLLELQQAAERATSTEPSDVQKQAWLSAQGIESPKDEDWARAYQALRTEPVQALQAFRQSVGLDKAPAAVPAVTIPSAATPAAIEQPVVAAAAAAATHITTPEEYAALPSGAIYVFSDGQPRRKK